MLHQLRECAFYGRTLATIAAGGQAKYLKDFGPKVESFDQMTFIKIDAVEKLICPETLEISFEPGYGEGNILPFSTASLKRLHELCYKRCYLLTFDKVKCGTGRISKLFAYRMVWCLA